MIIAVDFDGTIVEHRYPQIGKEIPFAIAMLKQLQAEQHLLILWTLREGELLEEAVEFCRQRGLEFYAVNANHPDEQEAEGGESPCRKPTCSSMTAMWADCRIGKQFMKWCITVGTMSGICGRCMARKSRRRCLFGNGYGKSNNS